MYTIDVDSDGDIEIFAGTSGDLIAIDYKNETSENFDSWSMFKGSWKRSGYYLEDDSSLGGCDNPQLGDINCDQIINILDIVTVVNMVIDGLDNFTEYQLWAANINQDEIINILDIVTIVNIVMDMN